MAQLNCAVLALDAGLRRQLSEALESTGHAIVGIAEERTAELEKLLWRNDFDLLLAALDGNPAAVFSAVEALGERRPVLVMCGPQNESELILRSMRIGARDYLPLPLRRDALDEIVQSLILERITTNTSERGSVVGLLGAKGGVGNTSVACQLASALQESGSKCTIADLNLVHGDVALYHDLSPHFTIADLAQRQGEIDLTYVQSLVTPHASGVGVVAAPSLLEEADRVSPARVRRAVGLMREFNHFALLDLPRDWGEVAVAALETVDQLILVTQRDVPTLAHTKLHLELLDRMSTARPEVHLVVNRFDADSDLSDRDLNEFLGHSIEHSIPDARAAMLEAVNSGCSLGEVAPRISARKSFQDLAGSLRSWCGVDEATHAQPTRAFARMRDLLRRGRNGVD